jgi:hypothetical protein
MEVEVGNVHCLQIVGKAHDGQYRVLVARHFDGSTRDEQVGTIPSPSILNLTWWAFSV